MASESWKQGAISAQASVVQNTPSSSWKVKEAAQTQ